MTFLTQKMVKNDPSKQPKWAKFWPKISIFGVIYRPLELKIHPRVGPLRPKTKPKHFLKNSKTSLKKPRKRLFRSQNGQRLPSNRSKEGSILTENLDFRVHVCTFGAEKSPKSSSFKPKTMPKYFLNNSNITLEKARKLLFGA